MSIYISREYFLSVCSR